MKSNSNLNSFVCFHSCWWNLVNLDLSTTIDSAKLENDFRLKYSPVYNVWIVSPDMFKKFLTQWEQQILLYWIESPYKVDYSREFDTDIGDLTIY